MQTARTEPVRDARQCPACGQRFSRDAAFCPFDGSKLATASFEPLADPLLGTIIDGRYEPIQMIGDGGMGRVYKVRHVSLERLFAMKVLRRELAIDEELAKRFVQEAKATAAIKHSNIVQITDFGVIAGSVPYFVMELLVGRTLRSALREGPLAKEQALPILRQLASGLNAAHEAGIIHRDLKPENVFLMDETNVERSGASGTAFATNEAEPTGESDSRYATPAVRLVDFGASKVVGVSRMTREGIVFGTPHYMSPEQAAGQEVDRRADVYSFGVIMYEMLTGRRPFEAESYMGVLRQHLFDQPIPPSRIHPAVGDLGFLESVILRCMAKAPENRPMSMTEVLRELDGGGVAGRVDAGRADGTAPGEGSRTATPSGAAPAAEGGRHAFRVPLRSIRSGPLVALTGTLAFLAAIGWVAIERSGPRERAKPAASPGAVVSANFAVAAPEALAVPSAAPSPPLASSTSARALPGAPSSTAAGTASAVPFPGVAPGPAAAASAKVPRSRRRNDLPVRNGRQPGGAPDDIGDPFAGHR